MLFARCAVIVACVACASSSSSSSSPPAGSSSAADAFLVEDLALLNSTDAPDLLELHPKNFARETGGGGEKGKGATAASGAAHSGVVVVAFIHPHLENSARLHPILHGLNQYYEGREDVVVAYADVHRHRSFFVPRYKFKALPAILAFGKGPNMNLAPVHIPFRENKTLAEYRREIDVLAQSTNGLHTVDSTVIRRAAALIDSVVAREAEEAARLAGEAKGTAGGGGNGEAPAAAAVAVDAAGAIVETADASPSSSSPNATDDGSATDPPVPESTRRVRMLLADAEAEIESALKAVEVSRRKLVFLRDSLRTMAGEPTAASATGVQAGAATGAAAAMSASSSPGGSGVAFLAHAMNRQRAMMLTQASALPIDADLTPASAAERNELFANIAILTDLFTEVRG
jgi:hypothetical protein